MKGMEGEADANNDNEITAGELHSYVQTNVIQQSSGSQTPELQGDADRVLVRFQVDCPYLPNKHIFMIASVHSHLL
jgi:hypothetical protein